MPDDMSSATKDKPKTSGMAKPSPAQVTERARAAPTPFAAEIWPPADPKVLLATCMKDEGPFILEWLAWHKAIGVTDFVVFSNDCTDGTDTLLDHLDAMGELTHLPNPASLIDQNWFQPAALGYAQRMPVYRRAQFFLSSDVDEFVNIHTGDGTISALLSAVPEFDVLSMCELNHGSNDIETYSPGWVTENFPRHASLSPGPRKAQVGVKSLTRLSERVQKIRNHRPDLRVTPQEAVWLDGSGNPTSDLAEDPDRNGVDCRNRRDLVTLEHYPLRSLDSYLVKMFRGDVVIAGKKVSERYWRIRNANEPAAHDLGPGIARARAVHAEFEADDRLMNLHGACCDAHTARIEQLLDIPEFAQRRAKILNEGW